MAGWPKRGRTSERSRALAGVPGRKKPSPVITVTRMDFQPTPPPAGAPSAWQLPDEDRDGDAHGWREVVRWA
jgi:hypothetical protein